MVTFRLSMAPITLLSAGALGVLLFRILLVLRLKAFFSRTETKIDDIFIDAVEGHIALWFFLAGLASAAEASPLPQGHQLLVQKFVVAGFFISVTLSVSR